MSLCFCGKCGARLNGSSAKSGRNLYYACKNYATYGKYACDARLIPKEALEDYVIEKIKEHLLSVDNINAMVQQLNEDIEGSRSERSGELSVVEAQLEEAGEKLSKLYNALESGKLDIDHLAPRIKETKGAYFGKSDRLFRSHLTGSFGFD